MLEDLGMDEGAGVMGTGVVCSGCAGGHGWVE